MDSLGNSQLNKHQNLMNKTQNFTLRSNSNNSPMNINLVAPSTGFNDISSPQIRVTQ
jgi:hypothetical protein